MRKYLMTNVSKAGSYDLTFNAVCFESAIKFFKQEVKRLHLKSSRLMLYSDRELDSPLATSNSNIVFINRRVI
jgi:hypothetical protein